MVDTPSPLPASKIRRDPRNPYRVNLEKWRPSQQLIRPRNGSISAIVRILLGLLDLRYRLSA